MAIKICFDFVCDEALLFSGAARLLEQKDYSVCGFAMGSRWKEGWQNTFPVIKLDVDETLDIEDESKRIEAEYGEHWPASFLQADRFLVGLDREAQRRVLISCFRSFERLIEEQQPDIVFSTGIAYLYNLVALAVCSKNNIAHISLYSTRQSSPRFTYSTAFGGRWDFFDSLYKDTLAAAEQDTSNGFEKEKEYLKVFRADVKKPDYMKLARQHGGLQVVFIKEFFFRLYKWYLAGWGSEQSDYITRHPIWYARRDFVRIMRKKYLNAWVEFDPPDVQEKYYIFPLHLQPEASTLVLSKYYVNQLEVIKNIAKVIPLDAMLYVKEHPAAYGRNPKKLYDELAKIHNVKVIAPSCDSRSLIANSSGVIVLSGTMGWEAFLMGVPAFVLGSVFYEEMKGVYKISGYDQLGERLRSECGVDGKSVLAALKAIEEAGFPGMFDVHKLDSRALVLSEENIGNVADGIEKILQGLLRQT